MPEKDEGKMVKTSDCPVYLESQGKKWSPYITVTKELCSRCPFYGKQCDGKEFGNSKELDEMREKMKGVFRRWQAGKLSHTEVTKAILSLETDTCRIAVVRRKAELPIIIVKDAEGQINGLDEFARGQAYEQETMVAKHFVEEVKNAINLVQMS